MSKPGPRLDLLEEIEVVEDHLHTEQICLGKNAGTGYLEDGSLTSFQLTTDGTAGVFGAEVQIYAGGFGAGELLDLDKVIVTGVQRTGELYLIEFWAGSGAFGAATRVASFYFKSSTATFRSAEALVRCPRVSGALNFWGRAKCTYAGASTIDMVFMSHKYPSDTGDEVLT